MLAANYCVLEGCCLEVVKESQESSHDCCPQSSKDSPEKSKNNCEIFCTVVSTDKISIQSLALDNTLLIIPVYFDYTGFELPVVEHVVRPLTQSPPGEFHLRALRHQIIPTAPPISA